MAVRIHVKCTSETIPGDPADRRVTMANVICQHSVGRDFDASCDRLRSVGQYSVDGVRCQFLLDVGPREAENPQILSYRWDGEELRTRKVTPPLIWYLTRTYSFNPDPATQKLLTDDELRAVCGEEQYAKVVSSRIEQKRRWGLELSVEDKDFLRNSEPGDRSNKDTRSACS